MSAWLDALYPQVGQRGTTVDVTLLGTFMHEPQEVLFYQPGIKCMGFEALDEVVDSNSGGRRSVQPGEALRMKLQIEDDASVGEYQLRLRLKDGLSEMVTFWVTPFTVVAEQHAWTDKDGARNDSAENAQAIPMNCSVYGYQADRDTQDHDWYKVECKKDERLSVEVLAARLGTLHYGGMNDPAIRIYDDQGNELGRNDDNALHTQDPVVSIFIPHDGVYFIDMHQQMDYEAARLRHYVIHVGNFPRPMMTYPLGGQAGKRVSFELLGDALGTGKISVSMPTKVGLFEEAEVAIYYKDGGAPLPTWPNRVHVASFGDIFEKPGHNTPASAQNIDASLPLAINGRIQEEGEIDWYRFKANKGRAYRIRTYAKTLDTELDARVWLRPAAGNNSKLKFDEDDTLWEAHDLTAHHYRHQVKQRLDPIFMFRPDVDGQWLIGIGDTRRESGPSHIYRIEFQPHVDSAFAHFAAYPSSPKIIRDRILLFPGHSYSRPLSIMRGFGSTYKKPLQLRAIGLPQGVTMEHPPFTQDSEIIPVLFRCDENVSPVARAIDLVVEPVAEEDRSSFCGGFVQVNQATNRRGDYAMYFNRTRKMALAVCEGPRFDIAIEQPKVPLVRNGELTLNVNIRRHAGFDGAVYAEMDWLPKSIGKQPPLIIPAGESAGTYKLSATNNAPTGEFSVSITGRENEGGTVRTGAGFHFVSSPFVRLSVGDPYVTIKLVRAAIKRGEQGTIKAEITQHKNFDGTANLTLGRLPFGVTQVTPHPVMKPGDKTAEFKVKVTSDCLIGQYKQIYCEVQINDSGQVIKQQTGDGVLRVDMERE